MFKLNVVLLAVLSTVALSTAQTVVTTGGTIIGETVSTGLFSNLHRFLGIPYAQAPVGNLRFRAPLPHPGWTGVRDGTIMGEGCIASVNVGSPTGSEDCLFLNVYTPSLVGTNRPVMFFIHGGGFAAGSGDTWIYGPEHIVSDNVVVVTVNYRLGPFGFLSTEDNNAPGNYALKDLTLALRWVQDNIAGFGGDRNSVTIFGQSAGSCLAHYLVLSRQTTGLFHRAISQSGSALSSWCFHTHPRETAFLVGGNLGITASTTAALVDELRQRSAVDIINATPNAITDDIPRGMYPTPFVPSVDPQGVSAAEAFNHDEPINIIRSGTFNHVPYIHGYTDAEAVIMLRELTLNPLMFTRINNNRTVLIPYRWNIPWNSPEATEITTAIYDFYFNGQPISRELRWEWSQFLSDQMFNYDIDRTVRLTSAAQVPPVYYYKFSFEGSFSILKSAALLGEFPGAVHTDCIFYLFSVTNFSPPLLPSNPSVQARNRFVRLWTNFARTSNPTVTLDNLVNANWPVVGINQEFIDFADQIIPGQRPFEERMAFWADLQARYAPDAP